MGDFTRKPLYNVRSNLTSLTLFSSVPRSRSTARRRPAPPTLLPHAAAALLSEPPVEVVLEVRAPGLVLCVYRRGDGWREPTCQPLQPDKTITVLPACMHYFHAAYVGEWWCGNDMCPLCRTAPPPPPLTGSSAKATSTA
jgi:hypothetical protein